LGVMILLLVLFVYFPVLVASPTDIVSLNYFVDTLLFSGAALVLADARRVRREVSLHPSSLATPQ
jgi:hypothetical protein